MKRQLKAVASLSVLGTLLGCAQFMPAKPVAEVAPAPTRAPAAGAVPVTMAALPAVTPAMPSHEALYTMGRAAHGAGQLTLAAQRYEQVLAQAPDHVGALNALAVIHAQNDQTDRALQLFARARQLAPLAAHIHNNAGYALMRAGQLEAAEQALKQAHGLDPQSAQTQQNLALLAVAQAERQPAARVVAVAQTGQPVLSAVEGGAAPRLVAVAPHVFELRAPGLPSALAAATQLVQAAAAPQAAQAVPVAPVTVAAPVAPPAKVAMVDLRKVRLEVSNGAGVTHLARRTAHQLAGMGVTTARLTNAKPYRQARTEIQFVAGQGSAAEALQSRLPVAAHTVPASRLDAGVQLRLVLGHDAAGKAIAAWIHASERQWAAAPQAGGWRWS